MQKLLKIGVKLAVTHAQIKARIGQRCPICAATKNVVKIPRDPASRTTSKPRDLLYINV